MQTAIVDQLTNSNKSSGYQGDPQLFRLLWLGVMWLDNGTLLKPRTLITGYSIPLCLLWLVWLKAIVDERSRSSY
jgi:hypothetical protein